MYPNISTSFSTLVDGRDYIQASHINALQTAIEAVIAALAHKQQIVVVAKARGDYTTLSSAATAITDASSSKPYIILLAPGIYETSEVTIPDYVSVIGYDRNSCILQDTTAASTFVLKTGTNTTLRNLTIANECDAQSNSVYVIDTDGKTGVRIQDCQISLEPTNELSSCAIRMNLGATVTITNSNIVTTLTESVVAYGFVVLDAAADLTMRNCTVTVTGPTQNFCVYMLAGTLACTSVVMTTNRAYCLYYDGDDALFRHCWLQGTANGAACGRIIDSNARFYDCTLLKHSSATDCFSQVGSPNITFAHCRFNDSTPLEAGLANIINTPYNIEDA